MNTNSLCHRIVAGLLFLAMGFCPQRGHSAAAPVTVEAPPAALKSTFNSQPGYGKDPFFPRSKRLERVKTPVKHTDVPLDRSGVPPWVALKGFAVLRDRKLAIINNYTVEAGEEFTLKHNGQSLKFKCVEIKESSVVISADGATKELQLRSGL